MNKNPKKKPAKAKRAKCVWTREPESGPILNNLCLWNIECFTSDMMAFSYYLFFDFCPYCGKPLEVKG